MKKFISVVALVALLGWSGSVFAASDSGGACPPGLKLRRIGTVATVSGVIAENGHDVSAVSVTCTSTACAATFYDADTPATEAINANIVMEPGSAASTSQFLFFETPITFNDGIYFNDDANVVGTQVYECAP